jgi:hypothetical protein
VRKVGTTVLCPYSPSHGDRAEQAGPEHRVERERHQRLLVRCRRDERLAAIHVGAEHDDGCVDAGDQNQHGEEAQRQPGGRELADLSPDES